MDLNSPLFDRIRIKQQCEEPRETEGPACEHPGCKGSGLYRAPKGRGQEGRYFQFCLDHVRAYNASYNYFAGMTDAAVAAYQKDAVIGHRPTWQMGVNAKAGEAQPTGGRTKFGWTKTAQDPFRFFGEGFEARRSEPERRQVHNMEMKSLKILGLDKSASGPEVKARYKLLVKRHHPDANGGDRSLEDRLREIIQAYSYLKSVGFC